MGIEPDRFLNGFAGVLGAVLGFENIGQGVMGLGPIGGQVDGLASLAERAPGFVLCVERQRQQAVGIGIVGFGCQCSPQFFFGQIVFGLLVKNDSALGWLSHQILRYFRISS